MTGRLSMRPTRRGLVLVALVGASLYMASEFGPRALDAVVAPVLVALVVGVVQVALAAQPRVERRLPEPGSVGTERSVDLDVEMGSSTNATVHDHVGSGLTATGNRTVTTVGAGPISYDLRFDERGDHEIGPLDLTVTDVLGLFVRRVRIEKRDRLVVYPPVYRLDPAASGLGVFASTEATWGNEEFEHLREYRRGDRLRDVDWKSSAKRSDEGLVVGEYSEERTRASVSVAVDASHGDPDEVAAAAASVVHYLAGDVDLGLWTPSVTLAPEAGDAHRRSMLVALARLSSGAPDANALERADLVVAGDGDGTILRTDHSSVAFADVVANRDEVPVADGSPAAGSTARAEVSP